MIQPDRWASCMGRRALHGRHLDVPPQCGASRPTDPSLFGVKQAGSSVALAKRVNVSCNGSAHSKRNEWLVVMACVCEHNFNISSHRTGAWVNGCGCMTAGSGKWRITGGRLCAADGDERQQEQQRQRWGQDFGVVPRFGAVPLGQRFVTH